MNTQDAFQRRGSPSPLFQAFADRRGFSLKLGAQLLLLLPPRASSDRPLGIGCNNVQTLFLPCPSAIHGTVHARQRVSHHALPGRAVGGMGVEDGVPSWPAAQGSHQGSLHQPAAVSRWLSPRRRPRRQEWKGCVAAAWSVRPGLPSNRPSVPAPCLDWAAIAPLGPLPARPPLRVGPSVCQLV